MSIQRMVLVVVTVALLAGGTWFWTSFSQPIPGPFTPTAQEQESLAFYLQPESFFLGKLRNPREVIDGQTLDVKLQYILENEFRPGAGFRDRLIPVLFSLPPARRWLRNGADRQWQLYTRESAPMRAVEDRDIPGRDGPVRVRIFHPAVAAPGPLPILVYSHGGGWVFASVDALDRVTRLIANEAGSIVVSVNFRLAPEHPYPAASDDGEDAFLWARENAAALGGAPQLVGVGGDSAGGHVSINVTQRQIKAGRPLPRALLLYYPGTGLPLKDRSYELFARGYGLDTSFIEFILPIVFPGMTETDARDDLMDPLRARSLAGFPPTILSTAGFDILRDSGRAFADRLKAEGAQVRYYNWESLAHSFLQHSAILPAAEQATVVPARLFGAVMREGSFTADTVAKMQTTAATTTPIP